MRGHPGRSGRHAMTPPSLTIGQASQLD